jgi:hypothetical protein
MSQNDTTPPKEYEEELWAKLFEKNFVETIWPLIKEQRGVQDLRNIWRQDYKAIYEKSRLFKKKPVNDENVLWTEVMKNLFNQTCKKNWK